MVSNRSWVFSAFTNDLYNSGWCLLSITQSLVYKTKISWITASKSTKSRLDSRVNSNTGTHRDTEAYFKPACQNGCQNFTVDTSTMLHQKEWKSRQPSKTISRDQYVISRGQSSHKTPLEFLWKANFTQTTDGYKSHQDPLNSLSRPEQITIFRLRTGHCGLRARLKRIGIHLPNLLCATAL